jgi:hypothetical protein
MKLMTNIVLSATWMVIEMIVALVAPILMSPSFEYNSVTIVHWRWSRTSISHVVLVDLKAEASKGLLQSLACKEVGMLLLMVCMSLGT